MRKLRKSENREGTNGVLKRWGYWMQSNTGHLELTLSGSLQSSSGSRFSGLKESENGVQPEPQGWMGRHAGE